LHGNPSVNLKAKPESERLPTKNVSDGLWHQMTAFRAVSHDDQIQLLKGGSIELLILRSVLTFDKDKQQFLDPLDSEETAAVKVSSVFRPSSVFTLQFTMAQKNRLRWSHIDTAAAGLEYYSSSKLLE